MRKRRSDLLFLLLLSHGVRNPFLWILSPPCDLQHNLSLNLLCLSFFPSVSWPVYSLFTHLHSLSPSSSCLPSSLLLSVLLILCSSLASLCLFISLYLFISVSSSHSLWLPLRNSLTALFSFFGGRKDRD